MLAAIMEHLNVADSLAGLPALPGQGALHLQSMQAHLL